MTMKNNFNGMGCGLIIFDIVSEYYCFVLIMDG